MESDNVVVFSERVSGRTVHNWPSNFFIEPDGTHVEGEFQAEKHRHNPVRGMILRSLKPGKAKRYGRKWKLTEEQQWEWEERKVDVMLDLVRQKAKDHPDIALLLLATEDSPIVEYNWWHDRFWGSCTCMKCFRVGQNWLGEIWMHVRKELREGQQSELRK